MKTYIDILNHLQETIDLQFSCKSYRKDNIIYLKIVLYQYKLSIRKVVKVWSYVYENKNDQKMFELLTPLVFNLNNDLIDAFDIVTNNYKSVKEIYKQVDDDNFNNIYNHDEDIMYLDHYHFYEYANRQLDIIKQRIVDL